MMAVVSSYTKDILIGLFLGGFNCLYIFIFHEQPLLIIAASLFVYVFSVGLHSKCFIAGESALTITGPSYFLRKKPTLKYTEIESLKCHFTDQRGAVNSISFNTKSGRRISVTHNIKRR